MGIFNGDREGNVIDVYKTISNNNDLIKTNYEKKMLTTALIILLEA